jgi:hypothetical protein
MLQRTKLSVDEGWTAASPVLAVRWRYGEEMVCFLGVELLRERVPHVCPALTSFQQGHWKFWPAEIRIRNIRDDFTFLRTLRD